MIDCPHVRPLLFPGGREAAEASDNRRARIEMLGRGGGGKREGRGRGGGGEGGPRARTSDRRALEGRQEMDRRGERWSARECIKQREEVAEWAPGKAWARRREIGGRGRCGSSGKSPWKTQILHFYLNCKIKKTEKAEKLLHKQQIRIPSLPRRLVMRQSTSRVQQATPAERWNSER